MYIKIDNCPLCNSNKIRNILICKDHLLTNESFAINECENCSMRFTNPRPITEELSKYYKSTNYISHSNRIHSISDFLYKIVRQYTLRKKLNLINKLSPKGSILDVGCGTGEFLQICKHSKWQIYGVEPDEKVKQKTGKLLKIDLFSDLREIPATEKYDVITLWHVLEHLSDLNPSITILKSLLKKNGVLVVALPNFDSFDAKKYKQYWAGYDVPRHLFHFNQTSMKYLAKIHELKLKEIIPMKFDAFYVSLLSEKYVIGKTKYIKSFINGLKSNSYAKSKSNNYSSLIYILRK